MTLSALAKNPLALRAISSVIGVPLFVGICLWGSGPFTALTLLLALVARSEMLRAYRQAGIQPNGLLSLLGAFAPAAILFLWQPAGQGLPYGALPLLLLLACSLIAASLWETAASQNGNIHTGRSLAYGLLCGAYLSLFGGMALLRLCPWHRSQGVLPNLEGGAGLLLLTAACAFAGDSAAFFVGRAAGRHKLAEALSPKKTTEGLAGGILASLLAGGAFGSLLLGAPGFGLLVGLLTGIFGPLGDLFKSALKREIGIKDFGTIIPGHGGILDRFDSLLFTAPVVALLVLNSAFGH